MSGGLHSGRNITFFQTSHRFMWGSSSKFNNGWWSVSHNYGYLLQTNNRVFKEFFIMETIATIIIIFGMAWVISQPTIMR